MVLIYFIFISIFILLSDYREFYRKEKGSRFLLKNILCISVVFLVYIFYYYSYLSVYFLLYVFILCCFLYIVKEFLRDSFLFFRLLLSFINIVACFIFLEYVDILSDFTWYHPQMFLITFYISVLYICVQILFCVVIFQLKRYENIRWFLNVHFKIFVVFYNICILLFLNFKVFFAILVSYFFSSLSILVDFNNLYLYFFILFLLVCLLYFTKRYKFLLRILFLNNITFLFIFLILNTLF